jgi:predicted PilT family ATPase
MSSSHILRNRNVVRTSAGIGDPVTAVKEIIKNSHPKLHITSDLVENRIVAHVGNLKYLGIRKPNLTKLDIQKIARYVIAEAEADCQPGT